MLVSAGARLGKNPYIDHGVWLRCPEKFVAGEDVVISSGTIITASGGVVLGDRVMVGYGVRILSANHVIPGDPDEPIRFSGHSFEKITLEDDVWIASNAVVLPGVTIGKSSVVAAGAVVSHDVQPYHIVAGIPARTIKVRTAVDTTD